jgi:phosphate transport system protein
MAREQYQDRLEDLRGSVLDMGDLVVERLNTGLDALSRRNDRLARSVIAGDEGVNDQYLAIEAECIHLLALEQPVAGDLRLVAASFKIATDLERMGDLASNLGEYALAAEREAFPEVDVGELGRVALWMVEASLEAYATGDAWACREVAARDDDLDALCEHASEVIFGELIATELDAAGSSGTAEAGAVGASAATGDDAIEALMMDVSRLLLTIRDLERVGDHAVNVAARTLYMAENDPELIY